MSKYVICTPGRKGLIYYVEGNPGSANFAREIEIARRFETAEEAEALRTCFIERYPDGKERERMEKLQVVVVSD